MSEDRQEWTAKHMQALRNGIAAMTTKALGDDEVEAFAYEVIKALGLEPQDMGVDVLAAISSLRAKAAHLDTALAALEAAEPLLEALADEGRYVDSVAEVLVVVRAAREGKEE